MDHLISFGLETHSMKRLSLVQSLHSSCLKAKSEQTLVVFQDLFALDLEQYRYSGVNMTGC